LRHRLDGRLGSGADEREETSEKAHGNSHLGG
jgi:hypothetical protein